MLVVLITIGRIHSSEVQQQRVSIACLGNTSLALRPEPAICAQMVLSTSSAGQPVIRFVSLVQQAKLHRPMVT
jgi:hypothetical protein